MNKKSRNLMIASAGVVVLLGVGGYAFMDSYLGNKVEIESVIPAATDAGATGEGSGSAAGSGSASNSGGSTDGSSNNAESTVGSGDAGTGIVAADNLNGDWNIADASKVYFSVTTSKETVNFENAAVNGSWAVDLDDPSGMNGIGSIELSETSSGNGQRDGHVLSADYFNAAEFPQAEFTAESFQGLPSEWTEGNPYDFTMSGALTVSGIQKEVTFEGKALIQDDNLLLSASTVVTFEDFGMKNPHSVVLAAENDVAVQLELVLEK